MDIKGWTLGMTTTELKAAHDDWKCRETTCSMFRPRSDMPYGPIVPTSYAASVRDGKVATLVVFFKTDEFQAVTAAIESKYGKPKKTAVVTMQNRMGAKFPSRTLTWERDGALLIAMEHSAIGSAEITLTTPAELARSDAESKAKTAEAAKKL
jgi:hypothetical protein